MTVRHLPPDPVMMRAFLDRDATFDGVFVTGVSTTGVFCRPTCPARKPRPEHMSFFHSSEQAMIAGFRPCMRCRPLEPAGAPPEWLGPLLAAVEAAPERRVTDELVRSRGLNPERVRRWFQLHHGMTFQAYCRARRLGDALSRVQGGATVARAAFDVGYDSLSGFQDAFRQYFGTHPTDLGDATIVKVDRVLSPLGPMLVAATDTALCLLEFADRRALQAQIQRLRLGLRAVYVPDRNDVIDSVAAALGAYFAGRVAAFDVPLAVSGTAFERHVWDTLRAIPYGETRSYADVAREIGRPAAVRAVGRANGRNAVAVIIPCHRVVGADGRLVGYGGGLWRKQRLLDLEQGAIS